MLAAGAASSLKKNASASLVQTTAQKLPMAAFPGLPQELHEK